MSAAPAPRGRDEIRAAVLAAARDRFAREGLTASMRDIAADAGVNLGLVHRHFGSKDGVVRAVFSQAAAAGEAQIAPATSFADAADRLLASAARSDDAYARMLALLLLDERRAGSLQEQFPTIDRVRELAGDDRRSLVLLLFLAVLGWPVFGEHLAGAVGFTSPGEARDALDALLRDMIAEA